jgi:hypothetical protein
VVLNIDVEKERISLGIKQLDGDPFTNFIATHDKNSLVPAPSQRGCPWCRDRPEQRRRRLPARVRVLP